LTLNALVAANSVLVPIQCEFFALEGISQLMDTIDRIKSAFNPDLAIEGVLLTMYDDRTNLTRQVEADLREFFGPEIFKTVIPRSVRLAEAPAPKTSKPSTPATAGPAEPPASANPSWPTTRAPAEQKPTSNSQRRSW